jgi:6-phosphofructokinase
MRVGMLTGGGDCPGLNAVIRAAVRKGVQQYGHEFIGFRDGWRGPLEDDTMTLGVDEVRGILPRGGTILGSSRTNPFAIEGGVERIKDNLAAHGCDALIAIGGEDTLGVATRLADLGVDVVGVPKTIDNDLSPPRPSTGCTRRPSRTTACSSSRSWDVTPDGSRCTAAWPGERTSS